MKILEEIKKRVYQRRYELSKHAVDQTIIRKISVAEFEYAILNQSELIENYPDDKYSPSCLILGFTHNGRPLHILCSYPARPLLKIITVYEPNHDRWLDFRKRKPGDEVT